MLQNKRLSQKIARIGAGHVATRLFGMVSRFSTCDARGEARPLVGQMHLRALPAPSSASSEKRRLPRMAHILCQSPADCWPKGAGNWLVEVTHAVTGPTYLCRVL